MSPPTPTRQLFEEALAHHKAEDYEAAARLYRDVLVAEPDHADANNLLGIIILEHGDPDTALELFDTAIAAVPDSAMFARNRADALAAIGRGVEAVASYRRSIALDPDKIATHYNLGMLYRRFGNNALALASFREAQRVAPLHPGPTYMIAALTGDDPPPTAPVEYITDLFDPYAHRFDEHLSETLQYRAPQDLHAHFASLVDRRGGEPEWTIVDLGCGTGLCGELFRPFAARLVGSDLSGGMLAKAAAKQVYDELHQEHLVETLARYDNAIDLAIAADVFIYVGDLEPTFEATANALRDGGRLAFTVESTDSKRPYILLASGRYAHPLEAINALATDHGLTMEWTRKTVLRTDGSSEIHGHMVVVRKSG